MQIYLEISLRGKLRMTYLITMSQHMQLECHFLLTYGSKTESVCTGDEHFL